MKMIEAWISTLDSFLWGPPMLILLLGCHIFLTFYLKFVQRYVFLGIKLSVSNDSHAEGDISQFGALAIALAATIGTGNIIGVGTAIVCGGPGAVFWCWLCRVVKSETAKYLWTGRINEPDPDCVRINQEGRTFDPDQLDD